MSIWTILKDLLAYIALATIGAAVATSFLHHILEIYYV